MYASEAESAPCARASLLLFEAPPWLVLSEAGEDGGDDDTGLDKLGGGGDAGGSGAVAAWGGAAAANADIVVCV